MICSGGDSFYRSEERLGPPGFHWAAFLLNMEKHELHVGAMVWFKDPYRGGWKLREIVGETKRSWHVKAYWHERGKWVSLPKKGPWPKTWACSDNDRDRTIRLVAIRELLLESQYEMGIRIKGAIGLQTSDRELEDWYVKFQKIAELINYPLPPLDIKIPTND